MIGVEAVKDEGKHTKHGVQHRPITGYVLTAGNKIILLMRSGGQLPPSPPRPFTKSSVDGSPLINADYKNVLRKNKQ